MPQPEYKPVRAPFCEWKMFSYWPGRWKAGCGSEYDLGNSRPGDGGDCGDWTYCPSCGRIIAVKEEGG